MPKTQPVEDGRSNHNSTKQRRTRILSLLIIAFCVLVSIVTFNTQRFQSKQIVIDADTVASSILDLDGPALVDRLTQAIRIRTISNEDSTQVDGSAFLQFHRFLETAFPLTHLNLKRELVNEFGLLYHWQPKSERSASSAMTAERRAVTVNEASQPGSQKPILLMSHIDVVPVDDAEHWTHPPFDGVVDDGFVYGRGTLDIKSGVLAILEATEWLLGQGFQPARSIYFAFGHDEEVGGQLGNRQIAERLRSRGVHFSYVLDEGGAVVSGIVPGAQSAVAMIGIAEKGFVNVELEVQQSGGHSASPPEQTTIGILSSAVAKIEEKPRRLRLNSCNHQMFDFLGPELSQKQRIALSNRWLFGKLVVRDFAKKPTGRASMRTTAATTIFESGSVPNVLPTSAKAIVNARIVPGDTIDGTVDWVRKVVGDTRVTVTQSKTSAAFPPSKVSRVDTDAFRSIHRSSRTVFPNAVVVPYLTIQATDARYYVELADDVYRYIPMRLNDEDVERIHGIDERIAIENYLEIVRFYVALIKNSAGGVRGK